VVLVELVLLVAFAGLGVLAQRHAPASLRTVVWLAFYWVVSPVLVLARVHDIRPRLMRLLVIGSTVPAVAGVALASTIVR
jgi:hypothetical protein